MAINNIPGRADIEGTIVSNLVLAGLLLPNEIARYMRALSRYDGLEIMRQLIESHNLRHHSLEDIARARRN